LPVHVVQRGNNRQVCFTCDSDLKAFANWLHEGASGYDVKIHAWVFMTNHVHLLLTPENPCAISKCMQFVGSRYVRYFNHKYQRSGTLFEGRFKSSLVQDGSYFLTCQRYIELNPVRAGMVSKPEKYSWSSYPMHALGKTASMWSPHPEYLALGRTKALRMAAYRRLFADEVDVETLEDIRQSLKSGLVLGNDCFRKEIEKVTGQRQSLRKRGPKRKKTSR
jgi:putative transposase